MSIPFRHPLYASIVPALVILGAALGTIMVATTSLGARVSHPGEVGAASAITGAGFQLGGLIGAPLLNILAVNATAHYLAAHGGAHTALRAASLHSPGDRMQPNPEVTDVRTGR